MAKAVRVVLVPMRITKGDLEYVKDVVVDMMAESFVEVVDRELGKILPEHVFYEFIDFKDIHTASGGKRNFDSIINQLANDVYDTIEAGSNLVTDDASFEEIVNNVLYSDKFTNSVDAAANKLPKLKEAVAKIAKRNEDAVKEIEREKLERLRDLADALGYTIIKNEG